VKNIRSEVRLRRNEECSEQSKATEKRKKRLSEVWLRRSEKRFERSEATEKKKAREQQLENEEENSFCFFFVSNNCVFVWLKWQEKNYISTLNIIITKKYKKNHIKKIYTFIRKSVFEREFELFETSAS